MPGCTHVSVRHTAGGFTRESRDEKGREDAPDVDVDDWDAHQLLQLSVVLHLLPRLRHYPLHDVHCTSFLFSTRVEIYF